MVQVKENSTKYIKYIVLPKIMRMLIEKGTMKHTEIIEYLEDEHNMQFNDYAREKMSYGQVRWKAVMYWETCELTTAGYLEKKNGYWSITESGKEAISKCKTFEDDINFIDKTHRKYKESIHGHETDPADDSDDITPELTFEELETTANTDIMNYIQTCDPYVFQDMVAALISAMGYYVADVADKGKDGGIDILAYQDPLGVVSPNIKIQVKRYSDDNKVPESVITNLKGVLSSTDKGIVITSGKFHTAAINKARSINITTIDGKQFIELWLKFHHKMSDEEKKLLPIEPIYFLRK